MRALRLLAPVLVAALLSAGAVAAAPATASATSDDRAMVVNFARAQIGKPYKYGTTGLATYDCSGLVYRAFKATGLEALIGGRYRSAAGTYKYFAERGLVTSNPRPGDIVAWGNPVSHVGIYSGTRDGHPMSVSALTTGVKEHRVHGVTTKFRAYLRVPFESAEGSSQGSTVPDATTTLPTPFKATVNLRKGSHTLYRLSSSGGVLEQRTIKRSSKLTVTVDPQIRSYGGQPYAQLKSGTWSGWWRRAPEAAPSCCRYRFPTTRTLRLASGDHLFKTFHDNRSVVIRQHVRVSQPTLLKVDIRATWNGTRHFLIAEGPMAGKWVAKTTRSMLVP